MNSEQLRKHAIEIVGVVWLVIVAVQYLSRYFIGREIDLKPAYVVMLIITVAIAVLKRSGGVMGRGEASASEYAVT